jgi:hypothetical protein
MRVSRRATLFASFSGKRRTFFVFSSSPHDRFSAECCSFLKRTKNISLAGLQIGEHRIDPNIREANPGGLGACPQNRTIDGSFNASISSHHCGEVKIEFEFSFSSNPEATRRKVHKGIVYYNLPLSKFLTVLTAESLIVFPRDQTSIVDVTESKKPNGSMVGIQP